MKTVSKAEKTLKLGLQMRDKITGFTGIATGKVEYLNGCVQFCLGDHFQLGRRGLLPGQSLPLPARHHSALDKAPMSAEGRLDDGQWIDSGQLEVIGRGIFAVKRDVGGPSSDTPSADYRG